MAQRRGRGRDSINVAFSAASEKIMVNAPRNSKDRVVYDPRRHAFGPGGKCYQLQGSDWLPLPRHLVGLAAARIPKSLAASQNGERASVAFCRARAQFNRHRLTRQGTGRGDTCNWSSCYVEAVEDGPSAPSSTAAHPGSNTRWNASLPAATCLASASPGSRTATTYIVSSSSSSWLSEKFHVNSAPSVACTRISVMASRPATHSGASRGSLSSGPGP